MQDILLIHRFHFSFNITHHYLFPQQTMRLVDSRFKICSSIQIWWVIGMTLALIYYIYLYR